MKEFLKTPFFLGDKKLSSNIFCAPLAGCSDFPFRQMTSAYQPGLVYCEMVKMDALIRHDPSTYRLLEYDKEMHPIGAQLCGSKPEMAADCAKIIEDLGFDVIDLNCGCPVDKVTKDGSGSGLLKTPERIGEIIQKMVAAVSIPVTIKIRLGWDDTSINCTQITRIAESSGAKAICIHGRTREQGYSGSARWEYIKACKEAAKDILVIGNGDVFDALSAENLFKETGCDAVLIARGTMGQPWIIEDIYKKAAGELLEPRNGLEIKETLLDHMHKIIAYQSERKSLLDMRRICSWYLKNLSHARPLRELLNKSKSIHEVKSHLLAFEWAQTPSFTEIPEEEPICATC